MTKLSCPCNPQTEYKDCCQPYHTGTQSAQSAELLMRSRYSAYVKNIVDYLYNTTHPKVRTKRLRTEIESWIEEAQWISLEVLETKLGSKTDKIGKVEFLAEYKVKGQSHHHHELSNFKRHNNKWMYVDGTIYGRDLGA
ncbi:MAG: YchJ family protein [Candidatus Cloacimonetes bacterium]|nr:YchJ family protein [Candidatus Cloacimonadota bacterium]